MGKKLMAMILALVMVLSLCSVTVSAETFETVKSFGTTGAYSVWVCQKHVTPNNYTDVFGDGRVSFDPDTNTLTLNTDEYVSAGTNNVIYSEGIDLTVVANGNVTLKGADELAAIYVKGGSLTMNGGSWTIGAKNGAAVCAVDGDVTVASCTNIDMKSSGLNVIYAGGNVAVESCDAVKLSNIASASDYSAVYAKKGVKFIDCPTVEIQAGLNGIYAQYGNVLVDNCGLTIKTDCGAGIYQDYATDTNLIGEGDVTIQNCGNVSITSDKYAILASGVKDDKSTPADEDDSYVSGGNVTVASCTNVALKTENSGNHSAVHGEGSVKFTDCVSVEIESARNGIYGWHGGICIDNCGLEIKSAGYGIYQYDDASNTDFTYDVTIQNNSEVNILAQDRCAIRSKGSITVSGKDTSLNAMTKATETDYFYAIKAFKDFNVYGGDVKAAAESGNGILTSCTNIYDGTVCAEGEYYGFKGAVNIPNGNSVTTAIGGEAAFAEAPAMIGDKMGTWAGIDEPNAKQVERPTGSTYTASKYVQIKADSGRDYSELLRLLNAALVTKLTVSHLFRGVTNFTARIVRIAAFNAALPLMIARSFWRF